MGYPWDQEIIVNVGKYTIVSWILWIRWVSSWICFLRNHLFEKGSSEPKVHCWDRISVDHLEVLDLFFCIVFLKVAW